MNIEERNKVFIDRDKLFSLIDGKTPTQNEVNEILNKALKLQGLNLEEVATLLRVEDVNTNHLEAFYQETIHLYYYY